MKKIIFLLAISSIAACTSKTEVKEEKSNNSLLWSESIQTVMPIEKDTAWENTNFTNIDAKFDSHVIFSSLTAAVTSGKLKAYRNYPNEQLSIAEVNHLLVSWDSTATAEDPNHPGTMVSAPMRFELNELSVPQLNFHEKIELDTVSYTLRKKVSYVSIYIYKITETGVTVGIKKLMDVKLNDE